MGSFVFVWPNAAEEVYVTGTFDNWTKSAKLEKVDGLFQKAVQLDDASSKIYYKFVVDGEWIVDTAAPHETDDSGNINNVLTPENIIVSVPVTTTMAPLEEKEDPIFTTPVITVPIAVDPSAIRADALFASSAAPMSTTAALAGDVPFEKTESKSESAAPVTAPLELTEPASPADSIALAVPAPLELTEPTVPAVIPAPEPVVIESAASAATISSAAPESTTAALAKDVPLEKTAETAELPAEVPDAAETTEEPLTSKASEIVAPVAAAAAGVVAAGAAVGAAVTAAAKDTVAKPAVSDSELPGAFPETPVSDLDKEIKMINPLPAAPGAINPVKLAPGEPVPEYLKNADINANVKLDPESYAQADAAVAGDFSATSLPPVSNNMIPESSLPIASGSDFHISSAAPIASTAALAGAVPLEENAVDSTDSTAAVPDVVKESQAAAGVEPEAAAVPEKDEVEAELLQKVPEAPATSEGTSDTVTAAGIVGGITAAAAGLGAAAYATATSAKDKAVEQGTPALEQAAANLPVSVKQVLPAAVQEKIATSAATGGEPIATEIPAEVKESLQESGASPEAAANVEAVAEKSAVESELLAKVAPAESVSEPSVSAPVEPVSEPSAVSAPVESSAPVAAPVESVSEPSVPASVPAVVPAVAPEDVSEPAPAAVAAPADTATPAVIAAQTAATSCETCGPTPVAASSAPAGTSTSSQAEKKKKSRISSFFHKVFEGKK